MTEREPRSGESGIGPSAATPGAAPNLTLDLAEAARRVLAGDGRGFVLLPWQIAYCFALLEGRAPFVPPGCGVGKGWLDARLREALSADLDGPLW